MITWDTHLGSHWEPKYKANQTNTEGYRTLPWFQTRWFDSNHTLDHGVEQCKTLGYPQHDHGEVEQHWPERWDHFRAKNGKVSWDQFCCKSVYLVATFNQRIASGLDNPDPRQERHMVEFSWFWRLQSRACRVENIAVLHAIFQIGQELVRFIGF